MSETILNIEGLTAGFAIEESSKEILHDVTLSVGSGKTLAIVGESGSGKSVTCMHILRLLDYRTAYVNSGRIKFRGTDLTKLDEKDIESIRGNKIAMVFQEPMTALNPVMRCGKQVTEAIRLHLGLSKSEAKSRALDLFEQVRLPDPQRAFSSYPHELSGGQKQRVVIAMALSCDPELLIADEPTTALDVTVQKSILDLLKTLQQEREMSMIFITHDLGVVAEISDTICVMYRGDVVESGDTNLILADPKHAYTRGLLACRPPLNSRPKRLPTVSDVLEGREVQSSEEGKAERHDRISIMKTQEPILEAVDLSKTYNSKGGFLGKNTPVNAVEEVSFKVYPGETFGLVGESGCGKTTLSRMLLGLIDPTDGNVYFKGGKVDYSSDSALRALRKKIQIVFQDPYSSLNPRMKIGDAIAEAMIAHRLRDRKEAHVETNRLLTAVGLSPDDFHKYPHEFSGGQRQRIVIARALALRPEMLICDESVSALDVSVQAQILNLLNDLKEEFGLTLFFISHDLSVVKYMSDHIMVMNKGIIEEIQEADSLFTSPTSPYTQKLIDAIPGL